MISRIDSPHWKISTGRHFQNGRHNTSKIQHCPISSKFDMWVDNDVPNWFPTLKNFYRSLAAILKWRTVEFFRCQESIRDIIIYPHMKCHWNRTMLNLCGIVVAILKMATGRNFSMSGINSGHHYLPTYQILMISDNVEFVRYCGGHVRFQRPELIPDIEKFLPVSIFKMATTIPQKFNILRFQR
jgi:hypothetical protein